MREWVERRNWDLKDIKLFGSKDFINEAIAQINERLGIYPKTSLEKYLEIENAYIGLNTALNQISPSLDEITKKKESLNKLVKKYYDLLDDQAPKKLNKFKETLQSAESKIKEIENKRNRGFSR